MRKLLLAVLVFALPALLRAEPLQAHPENDGLPASAGCPRATPLTGETAMVPFSPHRFKEFRKRHQLAVDPRHVRPLTESAACHMLDAKFAGTRIDRVYGQRAYFTADGYYLAAFVDTSGTRTHHASAPRLFVFRPDGKFVATIAPRI